MADDVAGLENRKCNPANAMKHISCVDEPTGGAVLQIDLCHVTRDDGLGAKADTREEHFHLLG